MIITLGNWITAQAAKAAAQWPEDVTVAVNLSPIQLKAFVRRAGHHPAPCARPSCRRTGWSWKSPKRCCSTIQSRPRTSWPNSARAGVRFALDDFGTGYSSLGYINKYPFGKIKVDRSFVSGVNVGKKSDAIIRAVSEMASTLGMQIVAEGLETVRKQVTAVRWRAARWARAITSAAPCPITLPPCCWRRNAKGSAPKRAVG